MKKKINQILLLNGGLGKRVKSISKNKPKCLIKFNQKSFLFWQLKFFKANGIKKVIICAGYKSQFILKELKKIKINNLKIKVVVEKFPLGTGGAIKNCHNYLDDFFFVTYGDSWLNLKFKNIKNKFHRQNKKNMLCIIRKNKIKNHKPNILFKKDKIQNYQKNNILFNYIDYGLMLLSKKDIKKISKKKFDLSLLIKKLIQSNLISVYKVRKKFYEIGSLQGIKDFKRSFNYEIS